jgi:hypothetical protein
MGATIAARLALAVARGRFGERTRSRRRPTVLASLCRFRCWASAPQLNSEAAQCRCARHKFSESVRRAIYSTLRHRLTAAPPMHLSSAVCNARSSAREAKQSYIDRLISRLTEKSVNNARSDRRSPPGAALPAASPVQHGQLARPAATPHSPPDAPGSQPGAANPVQSALRGLPARRTARPPRTATGAAEPT